MQVTLFGWRFLALAVSTVVLLTLLRGPARQVAFLTANLYFVWAMVLGTVGAVSSIAFVVLGYGLVLLTMRRPKWGMPVAVASYTALFIYMRRYDFLDWIFPESMLTNVLSTIGLSFLLFKVLHVIIDARSGTLGRIDLVTFVNYCLNFTTFMMGPIQRYEDYQAQWDGEKQAIPLDFEAHLNAVLRILVGLVKVYILAVWLETRALQPDTSLFDLSMVGLVVQIYAFYFYLYLNFSGYCDVVIGVGSLMGVRPPENFNKPFLARNISDFWLRQHRSLTLWLTDYVFTPFYKVTLTRRWGSRHPLFAANVMLMVTMLVSGLWHGTTVSFLLFGIVHGLWFVIYRLWDAALAKRVGKRRVRELRSNPVWHLGGIVLTFNATAFTFIFFRLRPERIMEIVARLGA